MGIARKFKRIALVALLMTLAAEAAQAQTVYAPPRIQYGPGGQIFYAGSNPVLQQDGDAAYAPQYFPYPNEGRLVPPSYVRTNTGLDRRGWHNGSPFVREGQFFFSDRYPNVELGQYGFNADDIRNEAYANLPRISAGPMPQFMTHGSLQQLQAAQQQPLQEQAAPANRRDKAIPLLSMARSAHRQGNRQLVNALLYEAAKYDPAAAARVKAELQ